MKMRLFVFQIMKTITSNSEIQTALFDWIDSAETHVINGAAIPDFFAIDDYSYWWYVRARVFYTLFRASHQGSEVSEQASVNSEQASIINPQSLFRKILYTSYFIPHTLHTPIVHSNIFYNEVKNGKVQDKALHALMNLEKNVLRYELLPLPPKGVSDAHFEMRKLPEVSPTVTLDGILLNYLLRHPFEGVNAFFRLRKLRKRFNGTFEHSFVFPHDNEKWQKLLQQTIQNTATSLVICDLVRKANVWFLAKVRPKYVIGTSENNSLGRAFFEAAQSLRIPTFGIQHGSIDLHNIDYRFRNAERETQKLSTNRSINQLPNKPTYFFAWGDETRNYLINESGYDAERTFAVGRLLADDIGTPIPNADLLQFKTECRKPLLLFASQAQGMFDEYRAAVAPLLAQFCKENGLCCVVKPHPRETNDGIYRKAFQEWDILNDLHEAQGELYSFIAAADFGATCYSTVAWEMLWQRKPLIVFDPFQLDLMKVRHESFIFFPDSANSFEEWQKHLLEHINAGEYAAKQKLGLADGKTFERIQQIIQNTLQKET